MTSPEAQNAPDEPELFKYVRIAKERNLVCNGRHLPYLRKLGKYAHQLRSNLTPCEKRIMGFLRSRGMNFRMQHPIDYYIVDFYVPGSKLVIEVDGEQHYTTEGKEYDGYRDEILRYYDLRILRIRNEDIRSNFTAVCSKIMLYIDNPYVE